MKKNNKRTCSKSVYAVIAVFVLLVAAGITSYAASVPSGTATHAVLYVNTIFGKGTGNVDVNDSLTANKGMVGKATDPAVPGVLGLSTANNGFGLFGQVTGTNSIAVIGANGASGNAGSLGTANAGVEGTGVVKGVKGTATEPVGGVGVEGTNPSGTTGQLGKRNYGVWGSATSGAGVHGEGPIGVEGTATGSNYAGYFTGGKGLYANKVEIANTGFDESDGLGLWVIATVSANNCNVICANHGSSCYSAYYASGTAAGCATTTGIRYCWCGRA